MKQYFHLAKYFFKKNVKTIISFSIIVLIATVLFTSGLTINANIDTDYDKKFDELNTANVSFTIPKSLYTNDLINDIKKIAKDTEVISGILISVPVEMNDSTQDQNQIFYNKSEIKTISKYNLYDYTNKVTGKDIYIPYYIYANSSLKLNESYEFKVNDTNYSFIINGIIEEMQYGNYANSIIGLYLEDNAYEYLLKGNENNEVKTILIKSDNSKKTYNDVSKLLTKENIPILNKGYDATVKQSRLSVSNIIVLILLVFSIIILVISLLVTKFKIKQTIEEDITNMGVLKSIGYKNKEIIIGMILPYLIITVLITVIGIILSVPVINTLGNIISSQAGFVWVPKLSLNISIITVVLNLVLIIIFSYLSAKRIKKLNPIEAIRGLVKKGLSKNRFEIKKTKGSINLILALKNFANSISSNILLGSVLLFITILSSFVAILFYNVNVNPINFINTLVEEHPTVMVKQKEDIKDELVKLDGIKNIIYYDESGEVALKGNSYKTFISEDYKILANDLVYEGRNPNNDKEVAIGSSIRNEFNYNIGDTIILSKNGTSSKYEIVGFIQSVNYSGEVIELTLDGYKKIDNDYEPSYLYIYLEDETEENATKIIDEINLNYKEKVENTVNYVESMNSAVDMFLNLIKLITIVIIIITLVIIYLILNILISGIIQNKKQELGILKSIGYKTNNLIFQIVGGFMPSTILFASLGLILSKLFMNNIFNGIFIMVGAYKVSFDYPIFVFVIITLFIIMCTLLIGILLCRKVRKISVYSLIKD